MEYKTHLRPLIRRQIIRWGLSDALIVEVNLHLIDRLPRSPTSVLRRDPSLFGGEGMTYRLEFIDPFNRLLEHTFLFQVFYHADEQTLLVTRGTHLTAMGL